MSPARKKLRLTDDAGSPSLAPKEPEGQNAGAENPQSPEKTRSSLFVRSLPANTTSESLTALFSEAYPIKHATAVIDRETKQCRGFGFVTFADAEDAQRAKEEFNGHVIDGRKLRIEVAEPRHRAETGTDDKDRPVKVAKFEKIAIPQQSRLIVRNLPWTIKTEDDLAKLFMSYGKVKQAYIPRKGPGLLAGFGFVIMRGRKNAEKALEGVNGKEIDGRNIAVDWAVTKDVYEKALEKDTLDDEPEETATFGGNITQDEDEEHNHLDGGSDFDDDSGSENSEDTDLDDVLDEQDESEDDDESKERRPDDKSNTLFVRNLPYTCTDDDLEDHFSRFGNVRYARVVMDHATDRSRGTGFVCFYDKNDVDDCLRSAPRKPVASDPLKDVPMNSILQNEDADPTGKYTMDGRVIQVARAVEKNEANRLSEAGRARFDRRDKDKRRLYLLQEGTIASNTKLWESLAPSEQKIRESSAKQRKSLVESNPSLHLSLTRLSVRNVPRTIGSKELKQLAREAVVGFAKDVKQGTRQRLSKEEVARGGEDMQEAERARKKSGKGIVKQAKVVVEGAGGTKVHEDSGAGRSRGYGFIEYYTHRSALMGLRWLNGHAIGYQVQEAKKGKLSAEDVQDRKKRLIVEFALENAQVVQRRRDKEDKARERSKAVTDGRVERQGPGREKAKFSRGKPVVNAKSGGKPGSRKRKRNAEDASVADAGPSVVDQKVKTSDDKLTKRNQIIGRKRAMRKVRKGTK